MIQDHRKYSFLRFVGHLTVFTFLTMILFGLLYSTFSDETSYLFDIVQGTSVAGVQNGIYFSGVTLFSIGYGDLVPYGFFRIVAILQAFIGSFIVLSFFSLGVSQMFLAAKFRAGEGEKLMEMETNVLKRNEGLEQKKKFN